MVLAELRTAAAMVFVGSLESDVVVPDAGDAHHLARVLRLRAGEAVVVGDGRGAWRRCTFRPGGPAGAELVAAGEVHVTPAPAPGVAVGFVPTKGDRPEWVVQKLTELGVDRIVVVASGRAVVRWEGDRAARHLDKLREVVRQAAMQSRRPWLPSVEGVVAVAALVARPGPVSWSLAVPGGPPPALDRSTGAAGVLVGPEGGWTEDEEAAPLPTVGLASGVLRAETAAVAAGALLGALRAGLVAPAAPAG